MMNEDDGMSASGDDNKKKRRSCFRVYEQLGAPFSLYRNEDVSYADEWSYHKQSDRQSIGRGSQLSAKQAAKFLAKGHRAKCRWYYPADHHIRKSSMAELEKKNVLPFTKYYGKRNKTHFLDKNKEEETVDLISSDGDSNGSDDLQKTKKRHGTKAQEELYDNDNDDLQKNKKNNSANTKNNNDDNHDHELQSEAVAESTDHPRSERYALQQYDHEYKFLTPIQAWNSEEYLNQQSNFHQQEARANVLALCSSTGIKNTSTKTKKTRVPKEVMTLVRDQMRHIQRFDVTYVPGKVRRKIVYYKGKDSKTVKLYQKTPGYTSTAWALTRTRYFDQQRQNHADPAYLAIPCQASLGECLEDGNMKEKRKKLNDDDDKNSDIAKKLCAADSPLMHSKRRCQPLAFPPNDPTGPTEFGNCLLTCRCPCGDCQKRAAGLKQTHRLPQQALLHPVGPLLDRIQWSYLRFYGDPKKDSRYKNGNAKRKRSLPYEKMIRKNSNIMDVGDSIRQLVQTGDPQIYVARTSLYCTVFCVKAIKPRFKPSQDKARGGCWGKVELKELHRIDLRSFDTNLPFYRPIDVACHPNYGGGWTNSKMAILCESSMGNDGANLHGKQRNTVHHVMAGGSLPLHRTAHTIRNLQDISCIDFSSHHPMVLWSAARSYVRPALVPGPRPFAKHPRMGHGHSLYSIDLRSNLATFQWSPAGQELCQEGMHSISGLLTDWSKANTVLVSSTSAGKTWEIDTRMPCQVVNSWSLPYACDDAATAIPAAGIYGAGVLLACPPSNNLQSDMKKPNLSQEEPRPILSIGKNPGTFGLHLYQRPDVGPRFQTESIECNAVPGLGIAGETMSVAASSVYALPDVSDDVFTCGLAPFRCPVNHFFGSSDAIKKLGYHGGRDDVTDILCAITMTNQGNLYSHTMVESKASYRQSRSYTDLPVGTAAVAIPQSLLHGKRGGNNAFSTSSQRPNKLKTQSQEFRGDAHKTKLLRRGKYELHLRLTNTFPTPHSAMKVNPRNVNVDDAVDTDHTVIFEENHARVKILSNAMSDGVVARRQGTNDRIDQNSVRLPALLVSNAQKQLGTTLSCFDLHSRPELPGGEDDNSTYSEDKPTDQQPCRSDVTTETLKLSFNNWNEDEDTESDS